MEIIDWNFAEEPFFLELQDGGVSLADWSSRDSSLSSLDFQSRVSLAKEIVFQVSKLHDAGVLHRDLKPENILLDRGAELEKPFRIKLIDMGSGSLLDQDRLDQLKITRLGFSRGEQQSMSEASVGYIAPEVMKGQSQTMRSDVYALGMLVLQIVTADLTRAFGADWATEISDPVLSGDIEKASSKNPEHRFNSAADFYFSLSALEKRRSERKLKIRQAEELESLRAENQRARDRRPWIYSSAFSVVVGIIVGLYYLDQAIIARKYAESQLEQKIAANTFLKEVIAVADPRAPKSLPNATLKQALDRAAKTAIGDLSVNADAKDTVLVTLADSYSAIADYKAAIEVFDQIITHRILNLGSNHSKTLNATFAKVRSLIQDSQFAAAQDLILELDQRRSRFNNKREFDLYAAMAAGQVNLAQLQYKAAAEHYRRALSLFSEDKSPDLSLLFDARLNLGQAYSRLGQGSEAVQMFESILKPLFTESSDILPYRLVRGRQQLGASYIFIGKNEEAIKILEKVRVSMIALYGPEHQLVGETDNLLGQASANLFEWDMAAKHMLRSSEITCRAAGDKHMTCLGARANLGAIQLRTGNARGAAKSLTAVREPFYKLLGESSPVVVWIDFHLAEAWLGTNQPEKVTALLPHFTAEKLNAASPAEPWETRIAVVKARHDLRLGNREQASKKLIQLIKEMRERKFDERYIVEVSAELNSYLKSIED